MCVSGGLTFGVGQSAATTADYSRADATSAGTEIARVEGVGPPPRYADSNGLLGHDVSGHQGTVDWGAAWGNGGRFVYVKATEGTGYTNPSFGQQYDGAYDVGMVRGAYHFARFDVSSGAAQADYFLAHGGGWSDDGRTLPGAIDAEYNPYGDACYGMTPQAISQWLADFSNTYRARTGRLPAIYTSTSWWTKCTGNNAGFGANPLWLARYNTEIGVLPAGWKRQTIWQYADSGALPGDQNLFAGTQSGVLAFATDR
nr:lysozyme [Amycolatopsis acidicola]